MQTPWEGGRQFGYFVWEGALWDVKGECLFWCTPWTLAKGAKLALFAVEGVWGGEMGLSCWKGIFHGRN